MARLRGEITLDVRASPDVPGGASRGRWVDPLRDPAGDPPPTLLLADIARARTATGGTDYQERMLQVAGPVVLARFTESGHPVKQVEAQRKIGEKIDHDPRASRVGPVHDRQDPEHSRTEILPMFAGISTDEIAGVTGLSRNFAATIRFGKNVPHARHWATLGEMATRNPGIP